MRYREYLQAELETGYNNRTTAVLWLTVACVDGDAVGWTSRRADELTQVQRDASLYWRALVNDTGPVSYTHRICHDFTRLHGDAFEAELQNYINSERAEQ